MAIFIRKIHLIHWLRPEPVPFPVYLVLVVLEILLANGADCCYWFNKALSTGCFVIKKYLIKLKLKWNTCPISQGIAVPKCITHTHTHTR